MPHRPSAPVLAVGASLALALSACGISAMQSSGPTPGVDERPNETQRDAKRPVPKRNPNPTAYEVTLRIEGAPGPLVNVRAAMQYEVLNEQCLPRLGGMSGTRLAALEWVPVELRQIAPDTYQGRIHANLLVDEDYFGLGVCHWSLVTTQFKMEAPGGKDASKFAHHIFHNDQVREVEERVWFSNREYPTQPASLAHISVYGQEAIEKFKPEVRDDLFSMRFAIRKAAP